MSINTLEFAQNMTKELDKAAGQKTVTGFLADNSLRARFVGANKVLIPEVEISGLGDYDRDTGFVTGTITVSSTPYTLTMDRGRSFQLDREDNDETGIANLAGQVMGEFVRTRVVPEVDAYCLSKLAAYAAGQSQTVTGTPASEAYSMLTEAIQSVQNQVGYDEELVAFVNSVMWDGLQNSSELTRHLEVADFRKGELNLQVKSLNGVAILPVPDSRMKSAFDFYDGVSEGKTDGGFQPTTAAKSIGLLVLPRRAASLVKKTEQVRTFDPAHNPSADAWKFDYRLYDDLCIKNSMASAIYTYVY